MPATSAGMTVVGLSARQPAPRGFALVVIGGLEYRRGQRRLDAQRAGADVAEAVLAAGRHDRELPGTQGGVRVADPDIGLALDDAQHLLDRMQVGWRAVTRLAPLLEQAQLRRAVGRRHVHARAHAWAPFFLRLAVEIDDRHDSPPPILRASPSAPGPPP